MKTRINFVISKIEDSYYAIPHNAEKDDFKALLEVNETGKFIIENLQEEITLEELTNKVMEEYNCSNEEALESVQIIIDSLKNNKLLND